MDSEASSSMYSNKIAKQLAWERRSSSFRGVDPVLDELHLPNDCTCTGCWIFRTREAGIMHCGILKALRMKARELFLHCCASPTGHNTSSRESGSCGWPSSCLTGQP